jgi:hypothetical protein
MKIKDKNGNDFTVKTCHLKVLPKDLWGMAAKRAVGINPLNRFPLESYISANPTNSIERERLSVLTQKYWRLGGVFLTVGFLDNPPSELKTRILLHMNAWGKTANVNFTESSTEPQVRITRLDGDGHWSYLGTDILSIPSNRPTMNLDSFTLDTPESEFYRVVRHETGHTMGFPHEHMRKELIEKIDVDKAIRYFGETQGWTKEEVYQQVLIPLDDVSVFGTTNADSESIMCYQLPATITKDGNPIIGGFDINKEDYDFASKIYPRK